MSAPARAPLSAVLITRNAGALYAFDKTSKQPLNNGQPSVCLGAAGWTARDHGGGELRCTLRCSRRPPR